jgi:hypothetical protein
MHPIDEDRGFTAEINLAEVIEEHKRTVRSTLNAGATLGRVQRAGKTAGYFYIHRDLYKTLARIRARTLMADYGRPRLTGGQAQDERFGGSITERAKAIEHHKPAIEEETTTEIRNGFVSQLLLALNIDAQSWERVSGGAHSAAIAANDAFTRTRRLNAQLDGFLRKHEDDARLAFDEMYTLLKSRLKPHASWDRQLLDEAYLELDQHWHVLMLLPNGPFESVVHDVVERLEPNAGDGRLSSDQQALYGLSRKLLDAFKANTRSNETAWHRLEASFDQAQLGETLLAPDNGHPTLN